MHAPPYTLRQMEVFVAVARAGSMSAAAADLLSSPSAVATALTEFEKAIGVALVSRKRARGARLTDDGRRILPQVIDVLEAAAGLPELIAVGGGELTGTIRLGSYDSLSPALLPMLLASFTRAHPKVTFELYSGSQDQLRRRFERGELQVAITYNRFLAGSLEFRKLQSRHPYVLLPGDHLLADAPAVSLRDLQDDNLILLDLDPSRDNTLAWFEEAGVIPRIRWETDQAALVRALVGQGLGYSLLLQPYGHNYTLDGSRVVHKPLNPAPAPVDIFVAWRAPAGGEPRALQAFLEHLDGVVRDLPTIKAPG